MSAALSQVFSKCHGPSQDIGTAARVQVSGRYSGAGSCRRHWPGGERVLLPGKDRGHKCLVTCMTALATAVKYACYRSGGNLTAPGLVFQHTWERKQAELMYESCRPRPSNARVFMLLGRPYSIW